MKFKSVNELETFSFRDCVIKKLVLDQKRIAMETEALIVDGSNSQNRQFFASYLGEAIITLDNADIEKIVLAGNRVYDPDGRLLEEVDDKTLETEEYGELVEACRDAFLCGIKKISEEDGRQKLMLEFEIPSEDDYDFLGIKFYELTAEADSVTVEWDKYMNRVEDEMSMGSYR